VARPTHDRLWQNASHRELSEPGRQRGDYEHLIAPDGQIIGFALRTRAGVKPVYISPGNHCDLDSARRIVLAGTTRYRLPEPIRAAHHAAGLHQETRQE
jgi:deoxyribonuclease V